MLIQFSVKNFRSIKDERVLSLVRSKGDELEASNSFDPGLPASSPLLRSSAIYGANASGKSNFIKALMTMDSIVNESASSQEGDEIPVKPFLFDKKSAQEPTEFEAIFISEGVRYQYGFSANKDHIIEEWLLAYPKGRPQKWFSRVYDQEEGASIYRFGDYLTGQKNVWQNSTRENALFLSTAVQLNSDQLKPVFNWFRKKLRIADIGGWGSGFSASLCRDSESKEEVLKFINSADFNIHDIKVVVNKFDTNIIPDDVPDDLRDHIIKEFKDKEIVEEIKTVHKNEDGELVFLDFDDESDGTKKLFSFSGPWIDSLKKGNILILDELHNSFHPKMVEYLVKLFHNEKSNPNNAQLIFTTHETSILNQDIFRRDQIWFCEKDSKQSTDLYPLTDFSPRKDRENIELGYLSGRYGALPYIKGFDIKD